MKGHVVVAGGSGFIGQHLCRVLKNRGFGVTVLSRSPRKGQITWSEVEDSGLPPHTTAVVNLAGQNILDMKRRWSEEFKKLVWNSRIGTTKILARCVKSGTGKVSAFVTMSGVGIYKPCGKTVYTEESRVEEFDFLSRMCIELEKSSQMPTHIGCRQIIIRSGVVLGSDGGMIKSLYVPFFLGLGGPVMPGHQYLPWIHVKDISRLISHTIEHPQVRGILNGVAPNEATNEDFARAFGKALNRPTVIPLPQFVVKMMFQDRAEMLTTGPLVKPTRATRLGFTYIYPDIESACEEVVCPPRVP